MLSSFFEYDFLVRAALGVFALSFSSVLLGFFLHYRRLILAADALSHGLLPGLAIGFWLYGFSLIALTISGFVVGLVIVLATVTTSNLTKLKEDSTLSAFYVLSLALGVFLVGLKGSSVDLTHFLFGQILSISIEQLQLLAMMEIIILVIAALIYKPMLKITLDEEYAQHLGLKTKLYKILFLSLVMAHLVISFQVFGTLLSVGFLIMPLLTGQLYFSKIKTLLLGSLVITWLCSFFGLLVSDQFNWPTSPVLILSFGVLFFIGLVKKRIFGSSST